MNGPFDEQDKAKLHEILLAVLLQNISQPRNSSRVEAIKNKHYCSIETLEDARSFLSAQFLRNLTIQIAAAEQEERNIVMAQKVGIGTILVMQAKSAAEARSQINEAGLLIGNGDRNKLIDAILSHDLP